MAWLKYGSILLVLVFGGTALAAADETTTGVITDTMCGAKHTMMVGKPDSECVLMCVKGSSEFALNDGGKIWKLSDQKTPAKFAAKKVQVAGKADARAMKIKVGAMEPAD